MEFWVNFVPFNFPFSRTPCKGCSFCAYLFPTNLARPPYWMGNSIMISTHPSQRQLKPFSHRLHIDCPCNNDPLAPRIALKWATLGFGSLSRWCLMLRTKWRNTFVGTAFPVIIFQLTKCYFIWLLSDCGCLSWLVRPWDNGPWKISSRIAFFGEIPDTTFPSVQDSTYNILGSEKNNLRKERLTAIDFYWEFDVLFFWPMRTLFGFRDCPPFVGSPE